jgi:hypothetical protein
MKKVLILSLLSTMAFAELPKFSDLGQIAIAAGKSFDKVTDKTFAFPGSLMPVANQSLVNQKTVWNCFPSIIVPAFGVWGMCYSGKKLYQGPILTKKLQKRNEAQKELYKDYIKKYDKAHLEQDKTLLAEKINKAKESCGILKAKASDKLHQEYIKIDQMPANEKLWFYASHGTIFTASLAATALWAKGAWNYFTNK